MTDDLIEWLKSDDYLGLFIDLDELRDEWEDRETSIEKKYNRRKLTDRARKIARERAALLIAELSDEKKKTVQRLINRGMKNNWSKKRLAAHISAHVGLTARQRTAIDNYRLSLIKQGKTPKEARKLFNQKVKAERAKRARFIAENEVFAVRSQAKRERWREKLDEGKLSPKWQRQWITAADERTCVICMPLHEKFAPIDGAYRGKGSGLYPGPPVHPRCRCTEKLVLRK